ncbi:MAG TPA: hypothetical protein VFT23_06465 [Burkholderiales bacterium]|nr:hypothetical protein [Burkholderiales bacterium]
MSATIIICQAVDHQLISGGTTPRSLRNAQTHAVRVQLATYPRTENRFHRFEDDWMASYVAAEIARMAPGDLALVADHDTIERFDHDARLIRAEYTLADTALSGLVERALVEERSAPDGLLAWFWENSLELPPAGFQSLSGLLGRGGSMQFKWNTVRGRRDYKRALDWLAVLKPEYRSDPDYNFAESLIAGQTSVGSEDHRRLQHWLGEVDVRDAALFERFCKHALTCNPS